jgi:hypothetical protein
MKANSSRPERKTNSPADKIRAAARGLRGFAGSPLARWLVLALFVVQAVLLAFIVRIGTPPDESNHIEFIEYYAHHSVSPVFDQQTPTYHLGDKTREVDYLYHYTMSLLYRVLPLQTHDKYIAIRLVTVVLALLAFLVLANVFRRLGISAATITMSLLIMTNLPMVLMMSSAINNDVTVWLGAALGLWLLLRLWEKQDVHDLLWLAVLAIAGGLFKRTLLPLGFIFGMAVLVLLVRHFRGFIGQLKRLDWKIILAAVLLLTSLGLFVERVGGNLARYHTPTPSCDQVQGAAACAVFWGDIRASSLAQQTPEKPLAPPVFVERWVSESLANVVDIQTQGWRHEVKPARWLTPVLAFFLIVGVAYGFYYDRRARRQAPANPVPRWRRYAVLITLFFMLVHLLVNYGDYRQVKFFGVALNGRYILPSLLPLIGLAGFYWTQLLKRWPSWRVLLAIFLVCATIGGSGLIMMLRNPQLLHG